MNKENKQQLKTGVELINAFFKQLKQDKEQYQCQKTINSIIALYEQKKLTKTNIDNALQEIRNNTTN